MRHVIAWSVLLAVSLPSLLVAQPSPGPDKERDWLKKKVDALDPQTDPATKAKALTEIFGWLTDVKLAEPVHQDRLRMVLDEMGLLQLQPDKLGNPEKYAALLRDVTISFAVDPKASPDVRAERWRALLDDMDNYKSAVQPPVPGQVAARRLAARDAVIAMVTAKEIPQDERNHRCELVVGLIGKYIAATQPATCIDACMIADRAQHLSMVPVLVKGLESTDPVVRYWSAKGMADIQFNIYEFAQFDMAAFQGQIAALAACFNKESNPLVVEEIFRALGVSDVARMTDPRRNNVIYQAFMAALRQRIGRLGQRNLKDLNVLIVALNSAAQWEQVYREAKGLRVQILQADGQILFWAQQIYLAKQKALSDQETAGLEQMMLKSAKLICDALQEKDLDQMGVAKENGKDLQKGVDGGLRAQEIEKVGLKILEWVGGPGSEDDYKLMKLGVPPAPVLPPAAAPEAP